MWLDELCTLDFAKRADSTMPQVQAVRGMGTNAIPWLLKEFRPDSAWPYKLNQVLNKQGIIKYRFPIRDHLRRGTMGFVALGEMGEPAIPTLLTLVEEYPSYVPGALAGIGRPAVPALQKCLANSKVYTNSLATYAPIPGNTISEIFSAAQAGPFSWLDLEIFRPTMQAWALQSTNLHAQGNATWFLEQVWP